MFEIQATRERINNQAGLQAAAAIAEKIGITKIETGIMRRAGITLMSMLMNFVQGRTSFEELNLRRGDAVYQKMLGLPVMYAADTVRVYLDKLGREASPVLLAQLVARDTKLLKKAKLTALKIGGKEYIPVDMDVSILDNSKSKKEGIGRTYRGCEGYAPMFVYLGTEGYMLFCEMRNGSQHSQKNTPELIKRINRMTGDINVRHPLLYRLDSGHDAAETIGAILSREDSVFIIKWNNRRENPETWLAIAKTYGYAYSPRPGKTVWTGVIKKKHPCAEKIKDVSNGEFNCVFEITERTISKEGNMLLLPEIEVKLWWTNLNEKAETIIRLYKDHATSEQFHSELKSDMGVERMPSGKFSVNSILLQLSNIAFNILRFMGQTVLSAPEILPVVLERKRMRLGKVIRDLIHIACKIVRHGGKYIMKVCEKDPWLPALRHLCAVAAAF